MGGCCCCLSRKNASELEPAYDYDLEDNAPLSSSHDTLSAASMLRVDPNLGVMVPSDSHEPNSLQALVDLTNTQADARGAGNYSNKNELRQTSGSLPAGHVFDGRRFEDPEICRGLNESESKNASDLVSNSPKVKEELSTFDAPTTPFTEDEDVCPTCLEGYDAKKPFIRAYYSQQSTNCLIKFIS